MKILKIIKYAFHYFYQNVVLPKSLNYRYKDILKKNIVLKNSKLGKRCFIIGSGPSLKEVNLETLSEEDTFVVNEFDKHPSFTKLHPNYFTIIDTSYFSHGEKHFLTQQFKLKSKTIDLSTNVFLNIKAMEYVKNNNLFPEHKVFYIAMQGIISDKFKFNIEVDKVMPWPKNSILMCIMLAVYMGYKEIYLIGCEHNFLSTPIGLNKSIVYNHSYIDERENINLSNPEVAKMYTEERDLGLSYEKQVANIKQLFKNYRLLKNKIHLMHPDVKIFNATPNSFLDVFPIIDFKDIKF